MTTTLTPAGALGIVLPVLRELGIPNPMSKAMHDVEEATQRAMLALRSETDLTAAQVADALLDGRDPVKDRDLQGQLFRTLVRQMMSQGDPISLARSNRLSAIVIEHAPKIIELMAGVVETADADLAEAHRLMPNTDFHDQTSVTGLAAGLMTAWGKARDALNAVDRIAGAWTALCGSTGLADVPANRRALVVADLTWAELQAPGGRGEAWRAANPGHRLSLATPDEFAARSQAIDDEREEEARIDMEEQEHYKRTGMSTATAQLIRMRRG